MKTLNQLFEENFSSQERKGVRLKAGKKIAAVRLQAQRVTQKTLAQAIGLSQSAPSELERLLKIKAVFQRGTDISSELQNCLPKEKKTA